MPSHKIFHKLPMACLVPHKKTNDHCVISKLFVSEITAILIRIQNEQKGERQQPWQDPIEEESTSESTLFTFMRCVLLGKTKGKSGSN